jgi:hypothetical protein
MTVLVVDELDQLLTKLQGGSGAGGSAGGRKNQAGGQELLYQLFELPVKPHSSFVLIGIANSIDLTDRFLPRLRHRNCEPQLVVFPPYQYGALLAVLVRPTDFSWSFRLKHRTYVDSRHRTPPRTHLSHTHSRSPHHLPVRTSVSWASMVSASFSKQAPSSLSAAR